jgi:hypothetical protein
VGLLKPRPETGLIAPEQLRELAPRPKVAAGLLAFALLQVLSHVGADPSSIGLEGWTVEGLILLAVMWLFPEGKKPEPTQADG